MIEAGALLKDTISNKVLAQIKIRNLDYRKIVSYKISIRAFELNGAELEGIPAYSYLDIKVGLGQDYGSRVPVFLPNNITRKIIVSVIEVVFDVGSVWTNNSDEWHQIPAQENIFQNIPDKDLRKQYELEVGPDCAFVPVLRGGLFQCTCGTTNLSSADSCYVCHRSFEALNSKLDPEYLKTRLEARLKKEAEEREAARLAAEENERKEKEEAEQRAEALRQEKAKRKKAIKRTCLIAAAVLLLGFLAYATIWHIIPYARYQSACKALEAQLYDKAYDTFIALGAFSDSSEKAIDTLYQKGVYLKYSCSYSDAADAFECVPDYMDSRDQAVFCRNEAAYLNAKALFDEGCYLEAAEAFAAIENYSDSADQTLISRYAYAESLFDSGRFEEAAEIYISLGDYSDSAEKATDSKYWWAKELLNTGEYEAAHDAFKTLSNYEDSNELAKESCYLLAGQLFDEAQYHQAYEYFLLSSPFRDSIDLAHESEYRYAIERFAAGDYEHAFYAFKNVNNYLDASERQKEAQYQFALALTNKKEWQRAANLFRELGDYNDSTAQYKEAAYQYGLVLISNKSYKLAVSTFTDLDGYKDSRTKVNEAKYAYVLAYRDNTDTTTYSYLKDLKSAGYRDTKEIYNDLYKWVVTITAFNTSGSSSTNMSSISKYSPVYVHFKLSGGVPSGQTRLKVKYTNPEGNSYSYTWTYDVYAADHWYFFWDKGIYTNPSQGSSGTLTIRFYDGNGNFIGEGSVRITN